MKILFVTHYPDLYGANKSLLDLLNGLSMFQDIRCEVVCPKGPIMDEIKKKNFKCYETKYYADVYDKNDYFFIFKGIIKWALNSYALLKLLYILRDNQIDIVHTNSSVTFLGAYIAFFKKNHHVWHIREFVYDDYNLKYYGGNNYFRKWLKRSYAIAISKSIYDKRLNGISEMRKIQMYNGIISKDIVLKEPKVISDKISFAIIGMIAEAKNQLEAINIFYKFHSKFPNSSLYIVGSGIDKKYIDLLKKKIEDYNIKDSVIFTGYIKDVIAFLKAVHVLLMCSKNEALGRVTVEAMSQGVPVIGFNNAGTSEIIIDDYNGLLYNDENELLNKMIEIFFNLDLYSKLSHNALISVNKFTIENYSLYIYNYYLQLIGNG